MKQVGELVVAQEPARRAGRARPTIPRSAELSERIARLVVGDAGARCIAARMTPVRRGVRAVSPAGARPGPRPGQADPVRDGGRGDRARPLDARRDRRAAAAPDPQRGRSRNRAARRARRRRASRPKAASCCRAARERNSVAIRVSDDGRGIDRGAILAKAQARRAGRRRTSRALDATTCCSGCWRGRGSAPATAVSGVSGRGRRRGRGDDPGARARRHARGPVSEVGRGTTFIDPGAAHAGDRARAAGRGGRRAVRACRWRTWPRRWSSTARAVTAIRDREALVVRDRVDSDGAPARAGRRRRAAPRRAAADGDPGGRRAPDRARGGRAAGPAGHRGRAVRRARAACRRSSAARRSSPTARPALDSGRRGAAVGRSAWKTCGT